MFFALKEKKKSHSSPSCRKQKALYSSRQQCHPQSHQEENLYVTNNNRDIPWADPCPQKPSPLPLYLPKTLPS